MYSVAGRSQAHPIRDSLVWVSIPSESLPKDLATAHAMILAERVARDIERTARLTAEAAVAKAHADRVVLDLELERLRFQLAKARREAFGQSSEAGTKIGQFELALEDIEETIAAMRAAEEMVAPATPVEAFARRKPARRPLPAHLPRVRQVHPSPSACPCCAGRLHKLGEDITESLESVPATWFVLQHVREKFSCRSCEAIAQPPAPSHPIALEDVPGRCCWPRSPSVSSACICPCIARAVPSLARASRSTSRRWPIGWARSASL